MKKRQESEAKAECASSATPDSWRTIPWVSCEQKVRKLPVRIVEALKANRIGKVKSLQRILSNLRFTSKACILLPVMRPPLVSHKSGLAVVLQLNCACVPSTVIRPITGTVPSFFTTCLLR